MNSSEKVIRPEFSTNIKKYHQHSFLQKGFEYINRIMQLFFGIIASAILLLFVFSTIFSLNLKVNGMGMLEPKNYQAVKSELSALIDEVYVKNGDQVSKGQILFSLEDLEYKVELFQAQKELEAAQAALQKVAESHKLSIKVIDKIFSHANIRSKQSGIIKKVHVFPNGYVEKGDLLLELYDHEENIKLSQVKQDLHIAQEQLYSAELLKKLSKQVHKELLVGVTQHKENQDDPTIEILKASVKKWEKEIELLTCLIEEKKIYAPLSGIVLSDNLEKMPNSRVEKSEVVLTIGELSGLHDEQKNGLSHLPPEILMQQTAVEMDAKKVDFLKNRIEKTVLYSPIDGRVITSDLGRKKGDFASKGQTILIVANSSKWIVKTMVNEQEIPKIKIGNSAQIKIKAFPFMEYKVFKGKVIQIDHVPTSGLFLNQESDNSSSSNQGAQLFFKVLIELDDHAVFKNRRIYDFKFGMMADVSIIRGKTKILFYLWNLLMGKMDGLEDIVI